MIKGRDPNNYIYFNCTDSTDTSTCEKWRIISIENDNTIRIIGDSIGDYAFDSSGSTCTSSVSYNSRKGKKRKYKNNSYEIENIIYTAPDVSAKFGCNQWEYATLNTYLNETYYNGLANTSNIVSHIWNVGAVTYDSTYAQTLATDIEQEKATTWTGYVGLLNVSDYAKANTNTEKCGTVNLNNSTAGNYSTCKETTWLYTKYWYWTITPSSNYSYDGWNVWSDGKSNIYSVSSDLGVRPVLYLSSDIQLKGSGTADEPYQIVS